MSSFYVWSWRREFCFSESARSVDDSAGHDMGTVTMDVRVDGEGNPILDQFSEEGFVDLIFRITELVHDGRHYRFHATASHRGTIVGMDAVVVCDIQGGFDSNMELVKENVYRQGVRLLRSGTESDRLVQAISELYSSPEPSATMVREEVFTAIALHQGELVMEEQPIKLKIFGRDSEAFDEDAYYESFFNLDLVNGFVFWNEKDPDYRTPLLRALAAR